MESLATDLFWVDPNTKRFKQTLSFGLIQTQKGSNKRLFILTQTHSMHIFGEIPFINPQNDTWTTDKH